MIWMTVRSNRFRNALLGLCFLVLVAGYAGLAQSNDQGSNITLKQAWNELFQLSQKEKKGLTFYIHGQTVPGIVTNLIGEEAVEVKNQTSSRIIIRLDSVDAVALN